MTFSESTTPDITESIPTPLSRAQAASQVFSLTGAKFNVAISGIPFLTAANDSNPYRRKSAQVQKQQIDTSHDAGEQTLDGYWIRSQTNWDHGAGIRYYEPTLDPTSVDRFEESLGIDVWTKGKFSLLKAMDSVATVSSGQTARVTGAVVGGSDVIFTNENGTVHRRNSDGSSAASYTGSFDTPTTRVAVGGAKIYVGMAFGISYGNASGSTLSTLYSQAVASSPVPYWVKSRIIATKNQKILELAPDGSSGSTPGDLDTVIEIYEHPDTGWAWSGVAEGPSAIYAAGYSNGRSAIFAFSLQDAASGTVPELSQAYQVWETPSGEEIRSIHVTSGVYMGIGTTRGMRVAAIQSDGTIVTGPLLFNSTHPVTSITSGDRFFYGVLEAGHPDGNTGAVRVDLSEQVPLSNGGASLRFPYAWDARPATTGTPSSVAMLGNSDRVCIGITGVGIYSQSDTDYEATGYLTSGRIRYGTVINKGFRLLGVVESTGAGSFTLYATSAADSELYLRTVSNGSSSENISLATLSLAENYRIKTVLTPSGDLLSTPVIESMHVRALPAPNRQRLIQFPMLCMDFEQTAEGLRLGSEGYAVTRLRALEYVEENAVVVTVQDFDTDETYTATIEDIDFRRPGPRSADGRPNFGGYINLTVRKL